MSYSLEERRKLNEARLIKAKASKEKKRARPVSVKADRGRVRDNGYLAFLRRQPCAVASDKCAGPIEAAHIRFADFGRGKPLTGMQTKPDDKWCAPLCAGHHRLNSDAQHRVNERGFWGARGIDPLALAVRLYAEYQRRGAP